MFVNTVPDVSIGFRLPSETQALLNSDAPPSQTVPMNVHTVNIHYIREWTLGYFLARPM